MIAADSNPEGRAMRNAFLCFVVLVIAIASANGDEVKFKNGKTIECLVRGYQKTKLIVEVQGQRQEIKITTVDSVRIGAEQPPDRNINNNELLSLANAEIGQTGFLKPTLKVESAQAGRFIGATKTKAVIIQGVNTDGLVTGRWVQLPQRLKVVGTENASNGATLFVLEPVDAAQDIVTRAEDPALSTPSDRPLIINDVRRP